VYKSASEAQRASSRARFDNIGPSWCIMVRKLLPETCTDWAKTFPGVYFQLIDYCEETGLINTQDVFGECLIVHCLDRHTNSRLVEDKFHIFLIIFDDNKAAVTRKNFPTFFPQKFPLKFSLLAFRNKISGHTGGASFCNFWTSTIKRIFLFYNRNPQLKPSRLAPFF